MARRVDGGPDHRNQHTTLRIGYLTLRDNDQDVSMSVLGFGAFAQMARDYKQGDRVVVHGKADLYVKSTRLSCAPT